MSHTSRSQHRMLRCTCILSSDAQCAVGKLCLCNVCRAPMPKLVVQIGLYSIAFGFSWGPIGWLLPSEIHDLNTRSAGQSITVFTQLMSGAVVTQSNHTAHYQFNNSSMSHVIPPLPLVPPLLLPPDTATCVPSDPAIITYLHPLLHPPFIMHLHPL